MRVGVVGCGRVGARRAVVAAGAGDTVELVADIDVQRASAVAAEVGAVATNRWADVVKSDVDVVIVSTTHSVLVDVTRAALEAEKHVLCEKPLGRNLDEARALVTTSEGSGRLLKVGFNHRYHPAIKRAHETVRSGKIGSPFLIRAIYGHGGRAGYETEWRADPIQSGGGELLDQGVHLIDLSRWFMGDFTYAFGYLGTWFWDIAPLEDNALVLLRTADGRIACLQTSWTEWRNKFRFEVFGTEGSVAVEGLGGNYGIERLTIARRIQLGQPPQEEHEVYEGPDLSWIAEWEDFSHAIRVGATPLGTGLDGYAAAAIIDAVYRSARTARAETIQS